jgi:hypothetical protein
MCKQPKRLRALSRFRGRRQPDAVSAQPKALAASDCSRRGSCRREALDLKRRRNGGLRVSDFLIGLDIGISHTDPKRAIGLFDLYGLSSHFLI